MLKLSGVWLPVFSTAFKKANNLIIFSFKGPTSAFSLFVGNLVPTKEYEELKTGIKEFFGKKNMEVLDVRIGASK